MLKSLIALQSLFTPRSVGTVFYDQHIFLFFGIAVCRVPFLSRYQIGCLFIDARVSHSSRCVQWKRINLRAVSQFAFEIQASVQYMVKPDCSYRTDQNDI